MKALAIILTLVFYFINVSAQSDKQTSLTNEEITQLSSNLSMKLLLNESQTNSVTNLLKTYRSDLSKVMGSSIAESQNKIMSATNEQIVALLDSKQKMKFNVISADWWASVQKAQSN